MQDAISNCRLCGHDDLLEVYSLGEQHISGFWHEALSIGITLHSDPYIIHDAPLVAEYQKWPLTLVYCNHCSLLQLSHSAPQEILYARHYWYRSGTNASMKAALADIVTSVCAEVGAPTSGNNTWIDIGANDGTLLSFVPEGWYRVGVEPAANLQTDLAGRCDRAYSGFWPETWRREMPTMTRADIITAIGMFYDLEDPGDFVGAMSDCLTADGIIVCQLMCLEQMLRLGDVGNVCHEHLEYYSYSNLVDLFETNGLEIYRVEENDVNGGSYRIWARHYRHGSVEHDPDSQVGLDDIYWWVKRIEDNRIKCVSYIESVLAKGKAVWVYGASTKGCVILQYYGLTNKHIVAAADLNPDKHGKIMAGTGIPIMSEEEMRIAQPDYLLMLPYAFRDEFVEREADWHEAGGWWLIPLPTFEVV